MLNRRSFLAGLAATAAAQQPRRQPNVVLLLADDLGYGELGCQGNPEIPTPHIDSIAHHGVRYTNGYVTAPYCTPSRAGLLTGRYQTRFGHELNAVGRANLDPAIGLPETEVTLGQRLQKAGYATGVIGKWHLGGTPRYHPLRRGFDEFFGFLHEGHFFVPPPYDGVVSHLRKNEPPYDAENPLLRGTQEVVEREYLTAALAREAERFIHRHRRRPFFLYLPWNAVHSPMQATAQSQERFAGIADAHRRVFAGMLSALDDGVGRVLGALRRHGLEENTLVIFLSDNGGPTAELTSSNRPLRGGKGQLYEGGIRVAFLLQWKGRWAAGRVEATPVIATDIVPTVLRAAGVPFAAAEFDGVDLGGKLGERTLFWRYGKNIAVRQGRWKLVRQGQAEFALYDLEQDPGEKRDLAGAEPERVVQLRKVLEERNAEMAPPRWEAGDGKRRGAV
ncbi:MAG: sulfatase-like hydrolase/transferase [Acidobacteria bacterium]|nr:sulfatase-like hydrolase/transferase [Bryobacteraceae bacterium CoA2 C42]